MLGPTSEEILNILVEKTYVTTVLRKNLALVRSLTGPRDNHRLNLYICTVA
jgi:hypothetical protein